ncbi:MAG: hypothetical protein PVF63_00105 [Gammaproteobacteria bacterium]|jgi:hypothetical protein
MEVVLQWLDELDDFVFVIAASWRSLCRFGLMPGLPAAMVLTPIYETDLHVRSVILLSAVAIGSVLVWFTALLPVMKPQSLQVTSAA